MPQYLVRFARPVVYQPDHPKARRAVCDLPVDAPDPTRAQIHALRVTTGDAEIISVDLLDKYAYRTALAARQPETLPEPPLIVVG